MLGPRDESVTDVSLIVRIGRSPTDETAWAEFVDRYGPRVFHWSRGWGLQAADAEDVAQAVLVKLARQMKKFTYDPSRSFRGLLHRITRNAWQDWAAQHRHPRILDGHDADSLLASRAACDDLIRRLEDNFDLEILEEAAHRVRLRVAPTTWEAYRLMTLEGEKAPAVAEALGVSVASAFKAKTNVLKLLRQEVQILEAGPPPSDG